VGYREERTQRKIRRERNIDVDDQHCKPLLVTDSSHSGGAEISL